MAAAVSAYAEQHPLGVGHELARLEQIRGALQSRHPLVGEQQGHLLTPSADLAQHLQRLRTRARRHDAVAITEARPQVARHLGQDGGIVIDGEDDWPLGARALRRRRSAGRCANDGWVTRGAALDGIVHALALRSG
jgi:hypothetical protein